MHIYNQYFFPNSVCHLEFLTELIIIDFVSLPTICLVLFSTATKTSKELSVSEYCITRLDGDKKPLPVVDMWQAVVSSHGDGGGLIGM